jgi:hypothetical protein
VPTLQTYEQEDFAHVALLFDAWTPDPSPSPNWLGIVAENRAMDPSPTPSGLIQAPAIYAAWALDYDECEGDYEGLSAPVRFGRLTIAMFTEPAAGKEALHRLRVALRKLFEDLNDGPLCFDIQAATPRRVGQTAGGWYVENLTVPFCGG